jgi:TP901 family phage tail tape measure protein
MARIGGSRVFFDVVGIMQAQKLITDTNEMMAVMSAIMLDAFEGITSSIDGMFQGIGSAIESVVDPAMALGESEIFFRKFFDFEGGKAYEQQIVDIGLAYGFSATEALDAGAKMAQLGSVLGSPEAILGGAEAGMIFGLVGDMDTDVAMKKLVALGQQTGFFYEGTTREAFKAMTAEEQRQVILGNSMIAIDQLNTVSNRSMATVEELATAMDQYASSATLSNESLAAQASMAAILIQSGEKASKAGRGLKQMYMRIASDTGGAATALHDFGVATVDVNGDLVSLTRIMGQLKEKGWDELDSSMQQNMAQMIAGRDHANRFIKLMMGYEDVLVLTEQAVQREAGAMEELTQITDHASFAQTQMNNAMENQKALIGSELLPAITGASMVTYTFQQALLDLLTVAEDSEGAMGWLDEVIAGGSQGVAGWFIMADQMWNMAGGALEAFMNFQSLRISAQVLRAVMQQTATLRAQMNAGTLTGINLSTTEYMGMQLQFQNLSNQYQKQYAINLLDQEAVNIANRQLLLMDVATIKREGQVSAAEKAVTAARAEAQAQREITTLRQMATIDDSQAQAAITGAEIKIGLLEKEKQKINELVFGNTILSDVEQTNYTERLGQIETELAQQQERILWGNQVFTSKEQLALIEGHEAGVLARGNQERFKAITAEQRDFIETIKLATATGLLTKKEGEAMIAAAGLGSSLAGAAGAAAGATPPIVGVGGAAKFAGFSMGQLSKVTMGASMALMFFPENEDAMQASMILMTASMVPMIFGMNSMAAATDNSTRAWITWQSVITWGAALAAIAVALGAAMFLWKNTATEMADTTAEAAEGIDAVQQSTFDWGTAMQGAEAATLDFGHTTVETMEKAKTSVKDFANAREELFFGFSPSKMNQSLFQTLVNQGVGELYYRSEISIQNNFFGMTPEEAVDEIATLLEARLTTV